MMKYRCGTFVLAQRLAVQLIVLIAWFSIVCHCASLAEFEGTSDMMASTVVSSSPSLVSSARQFGSMESFSHDRAQQMAKSRQISSSTQDGSSSSSDTGISHARQLASRPTYGVASYPQAQTYAYQTAPGPVYTSNYIGQHPSYHNRVNSHYSSTGQQQSPSYGAKYSQQFGGVNDFTQELYPTRSSGYVATSAPSQKYLAPNLQLHEVIELAEPVVKKYGAKLCLKKKQPVPERTVVSFHLGRKVTAPIEASKVIQPEFYLHYGAVSHSLSKTTRAPPSEQPQVQEESEQEEGEEDSQDVPEQVTDGAEEGTIKESGSDEESQKEDEAEAETQTEVESQADSEEDGHQELPVEKSKSLRDGESDSNGQHDQEFVDKHKNDFGKKKLDKASNVLQLGEKQATKLGKKVSLKIKVPGVEKKDNGDDVANGGGNSSGSIIKHVHKIGGSAKLKASLAPSDEVSDSKV